MPSNPKAIEEKMLKVLKAWKNIAPEKSFGGMTLADFEAQVGKSLVPRGRLNDLGDQTMQQIALRDDEDSVTMEQVLCVVAGIIADPTEGANSALYEACGYVRKDSRKSGLTRKTAGRSQRRVKA